MASKRTGTGTGTVKTAHATSSIRAKSNLSGSSGDRKVVYRPVVDNPLTVTWPPLPQSVRHAILQQLVALIGEAKSTRGKSVADWRLDQHALRRGNTRGAGRGKGRRSQGSKGKESDGHQESRQQPDEVAEPTRPKDDDDGSPPAFLADLVVGINQVTRALESRIRWGRWELGDSEAAPPSTETLAERGDALPVTPSGQRTRKRKRTKSAAALPQSGPSSGAPPLGDHPAYAFLRGPPSSTPPSSSATFSRIDGTATPPYLLGPTKHDQAGSRSWQMLINSDARRLAKPAKPSSPALLPAHPAIAPEAPATGAAAKTGADSATDSEAPTVPLVDLVFVCKPDINPPSLVAHLPTMVAAANGVQTALDSVLELRKTVWSGKDKESKMQVDEGEIASTARPEMRPVLLVPLDVGAERQLADALGLRRVAVIAISSLLPEAASLRSLLLSHNIKPLSTSWLVPHLLHPIVPPRSCLHPSRFAPTTIKHVKTSAPLNPRAAVQKRKEDKVAKRAAVAEVKRKKRRLANEARSADGEGVAMSDDVYVAED